MEEIKNRRSNYYSDDWDGPERRTCLYHQAHEVIMKGLDYRIKAVEDSCPVPYNNHKWAVGIIITIILGLFSISIYTSYYAIQALHQIQIKQERLIVGIKQIKQDISEIKTEHNNRKGENHEQNHHSTNG